MQLVLTVAGLLLCKDRYGLALPEVSWPVTRRLLPVTAWTLANVNTGLLATHLLTVPVLSVLRRTTTFFVIIADFWILGKQPNRIDVVSVVWWVIGALIQAWGDLDFNFWGYVVVVLNGIATAGFYVSTTHANKTDKFDSTALLFYNSLLCIPFQFVMALVLGEFEGLTLFPYWTDPVFLFVFVTLLALGTLMNYMVFLSNALCGATATSITGQIKSVVQSLLGIVFFSVVVTSAGWLGIVISTIGCIYYCIKKIWPDPVVVPSMV